MQINSEFWQKFIPAILIIAGCAIAGINWYQKSLACKPMIKEEVVRGDSLSPALKNGDKVKVDYNYYQCGRPVKRDDLVIYDFKARNQKLIKFVRVLPGDSFSVDENSKEIIVNGQKMQNAQGDVFKLDSQGVKMLKLYEETFERKLEGTIYFIFGNKPDSVDSSRFGPVAGADIIGKVIEKI